MKENINKWCENLSQLLSLKEKHTVTFKSEYKPSNYFLPMIKIGNSELINKPAWFCEIWVDGQCVFRESRIKINETDEEVEVKTMGALMQSIFNHGIMGAKNVLDKVKVMQSY